MIKLEALMEFTLNDFDKLSNIVRVNKEEKGKIFKGDIFECDLEMSEYLTGNNALEKIVARVIEVIPEHVEEKKKTTRRTKKKID